VLSISDNADFEREPSYCYDCSPSDPFDYLTRSLAGEPFSGSSSLSFLELEFGFFGVELVLLNDFLVFDTFC